MSRHWRFHMAAGAGAFLLMLACTGDEIAPATTTVSGTVRRGPVTPVCMVGVPCDAPFSADFAVQRDHHQVAEFHSDSSGQYAVALAPGEYQVVPLAGAPVSDPGVQSQTINVTSAGAIDIDLEFDTGIR